MITTKPDVVIANGGAAQFKFGKPITMSINDIKDISILLKNSQIFVIHLDALNHFPETREYSNSQIHDQPNIHIPYDGEKI